MVNFVNRYYETEAVLKSLKKILENSNKENPEEILNQLKKEIIIFEMKMKELKSEVEEIDNNRLQKEARCYSKMIYSVEFDLI
jgi:hypothetical protein